MSSTSVSLEKIDKLIYRVRGQKVMLDRDLAKLYGVETKQLKRAVPLHDMRHIKVNLSQTN